MRASERKQEPKKGWEERSDEKESARNRQQHGERAEDRNKGWVGWKRVEGGRERGGSYVRKLKSLRG